MGDALTRSLVPPTGRLRELVAARRDAFLDELAQLVGIDSGTDSPEGVDRVVDRCAALLRRDGWRVERGRPQAAERGRCGDLLVGRLVGVGGGRILLLGHTDTVFPDGTAATRPFRMGDGRATGPGVSDMKAGLLAGIHAIGALRDAGFDRFGEVTFVFAPDEERGSRLSRPTIEREASGTNAVLVLEAARESGAVVSSRKGCTTVQIDILGRAAHAGVEPERGRNAILEAARKVEALQALNGRWDGATVNVGVLRGGIRSNVVAERASLEVDVRATSEATLQAVEREVERIGGRCTVEGTSSTVVLHREHRPMERSEGTVTLVEVAREIAASIGFALPEATTGGASDANTTSALGVPTLDGLGPIGGDDHSEREWLDVTSIVPRTALLAGLIARIGVGDV